MADVYYERLGLPRMDVDGNHPTSGWELSPRISPIMDVHASDNMDF